MDPLIEYETVIDGGVEAGATAPSPAAAAPEPGAEGEPAPPPGATEQAPAWTPDQIAQLRDMPEFQDMFASDASAIAEARFAQLLEQARTQVQPQQGPPIDINAFLDPMGENYGANQMQVYQMMLQQQQQQIDQALAPLRQQAEAIQHAEQEKALSTMVGAAVEQFGLKGGDAATARVREAAERIFQAEAAPVYGNTQRAVQVAIDRAVRAEHAYQNEVAGVQAQENAQHLATVNGAPAVTAGGSAPAGVTAINGDPLSDQQLLSKYVGRAAAINGR